MITRCCAMNATVSGLSKQPSIISLIRIGQPRISCDCVSLQCDYVRLLRTAVGGLVHGMYKFHSVLKFSQSPIYLPSITQLARGPETKIVVKIEKEIEIEIGNER